MKKMMIAAFVLLNAAASWAVPQGPPSGGMPPGKWWRRPEVVQRLKLTREQQDRLDQAFKQTATQLVDLKADVEKRSIELRNELDDAQPKRQDVQRLAARLSEARARLFERELMMLLDMRGVLTPEQWRDVRLLMDRRGDGPRQPGQRRHPRGGGMPPRQ